MFTSGFLEQDHVLVWGPGQAAPVADGLVDVLVEAGVVFAESLPKFCFAIPGFQLSQLLLQRQVLPGKRVLRVDVGTGTLKWGELIIKKLHIITHVHA